MTTTAGHVYLRDLYDLLRESYGEDAENELQEMIKLNKIEYEVLTDGNVWMDINEAYKAMYEIDGEDGEDLLQEALLYGDRDLFDEIDFFDE